MKAYLTAMLSNEQTLDWEEWLPTLMFSYNTQVHKYTLESPFFLTYLHDPKLPFFNIHNPRPTYKDGFVPVTTKRVGTATKTSPLPTTQGCVPSPTTAHLQMTSVSTN